MGGGGGNINGETVGSWESETSGVFVVLGLVAHTCVCGLVVL